MLFEIVPAYQVIRFDSVLHDDAVNYAVLSDEIAASRVDVAAVKKLGSVLGQLHKSTHSASNSIVVRDLQKKFAYVTATVH